MNKSRLSKANQAKVSKICQGCGSCCGHEPSVWFTNYAKRADIRRWMRTPKMWRWIQQAFWGSIAVYVGRDGDFKKCYLLNKDENGHYCEIERRFGYKNKPKTCREYICERIQEAVKP